MQGYCPIDKATYAGERPKFNWVLFIVLCIFFGLGLIYLIYYLIQKEDQCPNCGAILIPQPIR